MVGKKRILKDGEEHLKKLSSMCDVLTEKLICSDIKGNQVASQFFIYKKVTSWKKRY